MPPDRKRYSIIVEFETANDPDLDGLLAEVETMVSDVEPSATSIFADVAEEEEL